jgi:deazaflavin-dependent oxidoreductase (nitroreductase family)
MVDHREYGEAIEEPARRPARWLRPLLKAPAILYRVGLGWVYGRRFLLLTHRGRRTGRIHRTVLEVVSYDAERREATVVSAWGRGSDWYRNLCAAGAVEVQIGRLRIRAPAHRFLTASEKHALIDRYRRQHRWAARILARLFGWPRGDSDEAWRRFAASIEAVKFGRALSN